jgi:hypothetical protein
MPSRTDSWSILVLGCALAVGCSGPAAPSDRLACTIREQAPPGTIFRLSAELSGAGSDGARHLEGIVDYGEGSNHVQKAVTGAYYSVPGAQRVELLTFNDPLDRHGKLDIAVQPENPVFRRRGTAAVVMTGRQTFADGVPGKADCRTTGPA